MAERTPLCFESTHNDKGTHLAEKSNFRSSNVAAVSGCGVPLWWQRQPDTGHRPRDHGASGWDGAREHKLLLDLQGVAIILKNRLGHS